MIRIFLSWSGNRSRELAVLLSSWLPRVIQTSRTWMSDHHVDKGSSWYKEIDTSLDGYNFGIICVTPENYFAPWLLFEAGALSRSGCKNNVCPVLLGLAPQDLEGPLAEFQSTIIDRNDFFRLLSTINSKLGDISVPFDVLKDSYDRYWPDLEREVERISRISIEGSRAKIASVLKAFASHGLPEPTYATEAYFASGFESHGLYSTVMNIAEQRLYIFGRKNRKVFDKEHRSFISSLRDRLDRGFDFRVLFLDPEAPAHVLSAAHRDDDIKKQLTECIDRAAAMLIGEGVDPHTICRSYTITRTMSVVIVDDAVLYAPIRLDEFGHAESLTKVPFTTLSASSEFGKALVDSFERQWKASRPIDVKS
jgi:hypothetical protein